jgi:hypothetical protein
MVVATPRGEAFVWVTVWDSPVEAAEFTEVLDRAIGRRFDGERMREVAGGKRYEVNDREISWWGGDVSGRAVVIYTDAASGTGELIAPSRVKLDP